MIIPIIMIASALKTVGCHISDSDDTVREVDLADPLPLELQNMVVFPSGVFADAKQPEAGRLALDQVRGLSPLVLLVFAYRLRGNRRIFSDA